MEIYRTSVACFQTKKTNNIQGACCAGYIWHVNTVCIVTVIQWIEFFNANISCGLRFFNYVVKKSHRKCHVSLCCISCYALSLIILSILLYCFAVDITVFIFTRATLC